MLVEMIRCLLRDRKRKIKLVHSSNHVVTQLPPRLTILYTVPWPKTARRYKQSCLYIKEANGGAVRFNRINKDERFVGMHVNDIKKRG